MPRFLLVTLLVLACSMGRGEASQDLPLALILVDSPQQAQTVLGRLKRGESFAGLARELSTDPTASDGGFLGNVDPATLRLEIREAVNHLRPGDVSAVFPLASGYAIVKVLTPEDIRAIEEPARERKLALAATASVRLTQDASGYAEFLQAIRNALAATHGVTLNASDDAPMDLASLCKLRQQSPQDAIAALNSLLSTQGWRMDNYKLVTTRFTLAQLWSSLGESEKSATELEGIYKIAQERSIEDTAHNLEEVLGAVYLHRAAMVEHASRAPIDTSLIFPSHAGPMEPRPADAAKAIDYFTRGLKRNPANNELQWLLNLAYMVDGSYPEKVPKEFLIPPTVFASKENLGHFRDVAPAAGLAVYGNAGGVIVDDFDNDGLLDVITSQADDCAPLHFFHNNGDGTFTDRAAQAGLANQLGGLNIVAADYNNDGCMDLLVLRGGWEFPRRRSLLRNNCNGTFTDVTAQSGLLIPARASQSAVWADIDNDGLLDLFIVNEDAPSQLFLNKGDGTFVDISHAAGVDRVAFSKAVAAADYDNDGYVDFYVSNYNGANFLYHNNGNRTFTDVARKAGVTLPWMSFPAWFFDYDNDGWPDLFVASYFISLEEVARSYMGLPRKAETLKLYKNMRDGTFKDVSAETGLDRVFMPMGSNFGDIDNDGYLDIYLGMGNPSFASVMPNVLLHNSPDNSPHNPGGRRFTDITTSSGTGALAKGHGVAFADLNNDGDEDIFIVMGGPSPGDRYPSRLFENPGGHGNDWITLKLVGKQSNRGAIGARISVTVENEGHGSRTIYRTVTSGGSFGASPLQQHIGLGKSARIENLEIYWPASKSKQSFSNVASNQFLEIKEFDKDVTRLQRKTFRLGGLAK
jgi:tetratricopeptide (TPR) repeat protein